MSVLRWVKEFVLQNYEKSKPISEHVVIELDEIWHFLYSKKTNFGYGGYGKHTAMILDNLLTGNVAIVIPIR